MESRIFDIQSCHLSRWHKGNEWSRGSHQLCKTQHRSKRRDCVQEKLTEVGIWCLKCQQVCLLLYFQPLSVLLSLKHTHEHTRKCLRHDQYGLSAWAIKGRVLSPASLKPAREFHASEWWGSWMLTYYATRADKVAAWFFFFCVCGRAGRYDGIYVQR